MHLDAVILRRLPWREHDQLVVLYASQLGRLAAVAKGSLRASSRQASALDEGNLIVCRLVPGRSGMPLLTGAQVQRAWSSAKNDMLRWAAACAILETVDAVCFDGQPDAGVWEVLLRALGSLDAGDADAAAELRTAQASLLAALGHGSWPTGSDAARHALDDACERIAQRTLTGPALVSRLASRHGRVIE